MVPRLCKETRGSMKVGDLVKHPEGIRNVSAETYSCGIIVKVVQLEPDPVHSGLVCHVWWRSPAGPLVYRETALELISESPN